VVKLYSYISKIPQKMNKNKLKLFVLLFITVCFSCKKEHDSSNILHLSEDDYVVKSATIDYFSPQLVSLDVFIKNSRNEDVIVEFNFSQSENDNVHKGEYSFFNKLTNSKYTYTGNFYRKMSSPQFLETGSVVVNENNPALYDIDFQINSGMQGQYLLSGKMKQHIDTVNFLENKFKNGDNLLQSQAAVALYDKFHKYNILYIVSDTTDIDKPYLGFAFDANSDLNYLREGDFHYGIQFGGGLILNNNDNYSSDRGFLRIKKSSVGNETIYDVVYYMYCNYQVVKGSYIGKIPIFFPNQKSNSLFFNNFTEKSKFNFKH
jgi:hypothetical protein